VGSFVLARERFQTTLSGEICVPIRPPPPPPPKVSCDSDRRIVPRVIWLGLRFVRYLHLIASNVGLLVQSARPGPYFQVSTPSDALALLAGGGAGGGIPYEQSGQACAPGSICCPKTLSHLSFLFAKIGTHEKKKPDFPNSPPATVLMVTPRGAPIRTTLQASLGKICEIG